MIKHFAQKAPKRFFRFDDRGGGLSGGEVWGLVRHDLFSDRLIVGNQVLKSLRQSILKSIRGSHYDKSHRSASLVSRSDMPPKHRLPHHGDGREPDLVPTRAPESFSPAMPLRPSASTSAPQQRLCRAQSLANAAAPQPRPELGQNSSLRNARSVTFPSQSRSWHKPPKPKLTGCGQVECALKRPPGLLVSMETFRDRGRCGRRSFRRTLRPVRKGKEVYEIRARRCKS